MGLLGSFPFAPEPARGMAFDGLALNVLRSLPFSYAMTKGLKSTTRALKDLDFFRDETPGSRANGRLRWRAAGISGDDKLGRIVTAGAGSSRLRGGRQIAGRFYRGVRNGRGGTGRRSRCADDKSGNVARGEGHLEENWGTNGASPGTSERKGGGNASAAGSGESRGSKWNGGGNGAAAGKNGEGRGNEGARGRKKDGKLGELSKAGNQANALIPEGNPEWAKNAPCAGEGSPAGSLEIEEPRRPAGSLEIGEPRSPAGSLEIGEPRRPAGSALVSKLNGSRMSKTLSAAGLGVVVTISSQFKPMKGFMKSVKMATGVVSGVKTATGVIQNFQSPAGGVLIGFGAANGVVLGFETARLIVKAGKISKDFVSVWKSTRFQKGAGKAEAIVPGAKAGRERLLKGLKVSDGALTLVKLTKDFAGALGGSLQDGFSDWDVVSKSYDASNSVLKVFEGALGLQGGGLIGMVGKGFSALKGAVGGLGVSGNLVKAVVVTKDVSIVLLKGFGLTKTAMQAFKASQDGRKMVKWLIYRDGSADPVDVDLLHTSSTAVLSGRTNERTFELLVTRPQQLAASRQNTSPSLIYSLASLLLERFDAVDLGDPDEEGLTSSSVFPACIFSLSLPS